MFALHSILQTEAVALATRLHVRIVEEGVRDEEAALRTRIESLIAMARAYARQAPAADMTPAEVREALRLAHATAYHDMLVDRTE